MADKNYGLDYCDIWMGEKVLIIDTQLQKHAYVSNFNWSKIKTVHVGIIPDPPTFLLNNILVYFVSTLHTFHTRGHDIRGILTQSSVPRHTQASRAAIQAGFPSYQVDITTWDPFPWWKYFLPGRMENLAGLRSLRSGCANLLYRDTAGTSRFPQRDQAQLYHLLLYVTEIWHLNSTLAARLDGIDPALRIQGWFDFSNTAIWEQSQGPNMEQEYLGTVMPPTPLTPSHHPTFTILDPKDVSDMSPPKCDSGISQVHCPGQTQMEKPGNHVLAFIKGDSTAEVLESQIFL